MTLRKFVSPESYRGRRATAHGHVSTDRDAGPPPESSFADRVAAGPQPTDSAARELQVRAYVPGDEEWLVATYSSIFRERSLAEWNWLFQRRPGGPAEIDIRVLESGGRPVGSMSHIGVPVWVEARRLRLAIGCDMMIHPDFRGRGGAERLVEAFRASGHGFDLNFGNVNASSRHVTQRYMGTAVLGRVPLWIRVRTRGTGRNVLFRSVASAGDRVCGTVLSWPRPALDVVDLESLGPAVDELASDSAGFAACLRVRDSDYLRWHWLEDPRTPWRIRAVWGDGGVLRGIAVSGARGEGRDREGVIGDLLARDAQALRALVADAWARLTEDGCHAVRCAYRDPRPWARIAMLRSGFRRAVAGGPRVACGPLSPRAGEVVSRLESWYLTTGDADL